MSFRCIRANINSPDRSGSLENRDPRPNIHWMCETRGRAKQHHICRSPPGLSPGRLSEQLLFQKQGKNAREDSDGRDRGRPLVQTVRAGALAEFPNKEVAIYHIKTVLRFIWASGIFHRPRNMTVITAIKVFLWRRAAGGPESCFFSGLAPDITAPFILEEPEVCNDRNCKTGQIYTENCHPV